MKDNTSILFINSPHFKLFSKGASYLQLGILSIAAVLKNNNFEVKVYDTDFNPRFVRKPAYNLGYPPKFSESYEKNLYDKNYFAWREIEKTVKKINPDIVGLSFTTFDYASAVSVAKIVKKVNNEAVVIVGGHHVNALPLETMKENFFDIGMIGEGELTMLELVKALSEGKRINKIRGIVFRKNNRIFKTNPRPLISCLDKMPFPARELLINNEKYSPHVMGNMITSRGCPYCCDFCTTPAMYGNTIRMRSAENVFKEMEEVNSEYNTLFFTFHDDLFTFDKKRVNDLCNLIKGNKLDVMWTCITRADLLDRGMLEKMKSAGCYSVSIGVESGSQEILNKIQKQINVNRLRQTSKMIKELDMNLHLFFSVGHADETEKSLRKTLRMIDELDPDTLNVSRANPFPGTKIYEDAIRENRFVFKNWHSYYMKLRKLDEDAFNKSVKGLYATIYKKNLNGIKKMITKPDFILKFCKENIKSPKDFILYASEFIKTQVESFIH